MKTVLITRPTEDAPRTVALFEKNGFHCVHFPMIEISPVENWTLPNLETYDGLIFTSANAVRFFFSTLTRRELAALKTISQINLYAVGFKTKQALENYSKMPMTVSEKGSAADLAEKILKQGVNEKRFLFVRGTISKRIIPKIIQENGGTCDELCVYENHAPSESNREALRQFLKENQMDWIAFFSPSAVENFFKIIPSNEITTKTKFAVIGESTQKALYDNGFQASAMPQTAFAEELIKQMKKFE
jgi:uroporphyrinogen-III synthase